MWLAGSGGSLNVLEVEFQNGLKIYLWRDAVHEIYHAMKKVDPIQGESR